MKTRTHTLFDAFHEGIVARQNNQPQNTNPHWDKGPHNSERFSWNAGWETEDRFQRKLKEGQIR